MPRLTLDGLELQDQSAGIWLDIVDGGLDSIPSYRGEDDVIPQASGRDPGLWTADVRTVKLYGTVWGNGATAAIRRAAYRAKVDQLVAKMDVATLVDLVAHGPNEGIAIGQSSTLADCRPDTWLPGPPHGWEWREFTLTLVSIASPPTWSTPA